MNDVKYKIRVIRGAFVDPSVIDRLGAVLIEKINDPEWQSIDELVVDLDQIKELQKSMIKHSVSDKAPWYLDGYEVDNKDKLIVAFGSDDGENGKIYELDRNDKDTRLEIINYGISRGIPKDQMSFADKDF